MITVPMNAQHRPNRQHRQRWRRPSEWPRIRLSIAQGIAVVIAAIFLWASIHAADRKSVNKWPIPLEIFAEKEANLPPELLVAAARNVATHPDDLDSLAAITLNTLERDAGNSATAMQMRVLASNGMRSTRAQVVLLYDAARKDQLSEVIKRIDVLLRRRQLVDFGRAALTALERLPDGRRELVSVLAQDPDWRRGYLAWPEPITTSEGRANRAAVLDLLFATNKPPQRIESALAISALAENGDEQVALELWQKLNASSRKEMIASDPTFSDMAQFRQLEGWWSTPFDWKIYEGDEAEVRVGGEDDKMIQIYWDGRRSPTFLSQMLRNIEGRHVSVSVVLAQRSAEFADALQARVECPSDTIELRRVAQSASPTEAEFTSERAIPCRFPWLRIAGKPGISRTAMDIDIKAVRVAK